MTSGAGFMLSQRRLADMSAVARSAKEDGARLVWATRRQGNPIASRSFGMPGRSS